MSSMAISPLSVRESIKLQMIVGICSIARAQPITPAIAAIISIAPLITADRIIIGIKAFSLIFL